MKILVVDDEELVRWFLDRALTRSGHEVIAVSNISEAYEKLNSEEIDLLFLDLRMPGGDGTELLKKVHKPNSRPRIVVCSAFINPEAEEDMEKNGICILKKPFKLDELNHILNMCLEK